MPWPKLRLPAHTNPTEEHAKLSPKLIALQEAFVRLCVAAAPLQRSAYAKSLAKQGFTKLMTHPLVAAVLVKDKMVYIATHSVVAYDHSSCNSYELGVYLVTLDPILGMYKMENTTYCPGGYHHPHISHNGRPCFTEAPLVVEHCKAGRLAEACLILLAFLEGIGPGAAHYDVSHWPLWDKGDKK